MVFSNKDLRTAPAIARLDVPVSVLLNVTLAQRGVLRHHVREAGLLHDAPAVGAIAGPGSDHVQHLQRHEVQMNAAFQTHRHQHKPFQLKEWQRLETYKLIIKKTVPYVPRMISGVSYHRVLVRLIQLPIKKAKSSIPVSKSAKKILEGERDWIGEPMAATRSR